MKHQKKPFFNMKLFSHTFIPKIEMKLFSSLL
nr:MAG TPA: hypothetical protein [Caudoviricetes sp.]